MLNKSGYKIISAPTCFGGGYHRRQGEFLHCKPEHFWYKTESVFLCTQDEMCFIPTVFQLAV